MKSDTKKGSDDAMVVAVKYLSYRARSAWEMTEKLRAGEFDAAEIERVIASLLADGYLDDEAFARDRFDGRVRNKLWGPVKIASELRSKGVAGDIISTILRDFGEDEEREAAKAALEKWARRNGVSPTEESSAERAARHLRGRGFNAMAATWAVKDFFTLNNNSGQPSPKI